MTLEVGTPLRTIAIFILALSMVACTHRRGGRVRLTPDLDEISVDLSPESAAIRTEEEEFDRPEHGTFRVKKFFRGDMLVMTTMSSNKLRTRSLHFRNEDRYIESDEDLDGFYESIAVYGDSMHDFEMFRRTPDGSVEPISSDEYLELKEKSFNAMLQFWQALDEVMKEKPE